MVYVQLMVEDAILITQAYYDTEKYTIRSHITNIFPVQTSHYSRNHTNKNYFLSPDL